MAPPVYCILSGGAVHCVPVTAFSSTSTSQTPAEFSRNPAVNTHSDSVIPPLTLLPAAVKIKNKNLLYTLNNPLLSDLESDAHATNDSRRLSATSQDEDAWDLPPLTPLKQHVLTLYDSVISLHGNGQLLSNGNGHEIPEIPEHSELSDVNGAADINYTNFAGNGSVKIDIGALNTVEDQLPIDIQSLLEKYATHAIYLPQYSVDLQTNLDSDYTQIKSLLTKVFPSWTCDIIVKQLTGGITNMLLLCTHTPSLETLLMRVYGQGTNLIIDRHREFVSHLVLNSLKLAPPIHARFSNGLIYGFLPGRSLEPKELSNPYLYPMIAQQLGNWHHQVDCDYIEDGVEKLRKYTANLKKLYQLINDPQKPAKREKKVKKIISSIWDLIDDWILIVPANEALVDIFRTNLDDNSITELNIRDVIHKEFKWLKSTLNRVTKSSVVVSHCDLLSGNIIIPETEEFAAKIERGVSDASLLPIEDNPIQFIDYEYMLPAPRAFDIANHFAEWQGFDCDRSAIPEPSMNNPVMVSWCKGYLNDINVSQQELEGLINEIECYYGMPGFYWGIWAMIQSELSNIDFNYAEYSGLRLEEYWDWKKNFLTKSA